MDFSRKAQYFTLDVITDTAFGKPFGALVTDTDPYHYIQITDDSMPALTMVGIYPWLIKILQSRLFSRLQPTAKDETGLRKLMRHVHVPPLLNLNRLLTLDLALRKKSAQRGLAPGKILDQI